MAVNNLDNLIDKLYSDGINKVKKESDEILSNAKSEADKITSEAQAKASKILDEANKKAEDIVRRATEEMQNAYKDIILSLKNEISNLITYKLFGKEKLSTVLSSKDFIVKILESLFKNGVLEQDMDVYFSDKLKKDIDNIMANELKKLVSDGLTVKFSDDIKSGFKLMDKDGTFSVIFDEETVSNLFVERLRPFVKGILFGEKQ